MRKSFYKIIRGTKMKNLNKQDLDKAQCGGCDCHTEHEPLFLHAVCHMSSGLEAKYEKGVLYIYCNECHKSVVNIDVADAK